MDIDPESEAALVRAVELYEKEDQNELAWAAASALGQVSPGAALVGFARSDRRGPGSDW